MSETFKKNIVLCGVGGQGTILASRLLASAAMEKGLNVMSAETIGMAQRGGSVFSHLRIGEGICSPMIAKHTADLIIGFEPSEAVRMLPYLKEDGCVVVSTRPVLSVMDTLSGASADSSEMIEYLKKHAGNVLAVDTEKACEDLGSTKVLNVLLLGASLTTGVLGFNREEMEATVKKIVPAKFHELNLRALSYMI